MGLIKVNHEEFGLEKNKAEEIEVAFTPMVDAMNDLQDEYDGFMAKAKIVPYTEDICEEAKELRKQYVKIRTATDKAHKDQKSVFLKAGRFVDGLKNAQLKASKVAEDTLKEIEDYFVNIEKERLAKIQLEREEAIKPFLGEFDQVQSYSGIPDAQWEVLLEDKKIVYEARIKAKEDEAKRLEAERLESERIRKENAEQAVKIKELEDAAKSKDEQKKESIPENPSESEAGFIYRKANDSSFEVFKKWYNENFKD